MRILKMTSVLLIAALSLTGCDFFRSLVGKPTSADLERMKIEAQKAADRERFVADSLKAAEEAARLAAAAGQMPLVSQDDPRFHVIVGCFKVPENAANFKAYLEKSGYSPKRIIFRNGFDVVSIFQTDSYRKARQEMETFMNLPFCPDDIWIYDLRQELHE